VRPGRAQLSRPAIEDALVRVEATLFAWPVLEAVVARREAGVPQAADADHARALARELCAFADPDGSWGGDLVWTAESLLLLRELAPEPDVSSSETARAAGNWLLSRQDQAGRFGEGCDGDTHGSGLCEHFVGGFFSVAPPFANLAGRTLATGARFPTDRSARFGGSCLALDALLAWGWRDASVERHRAALRPIVTRIAPGPTALIDIGAYAVAVGALARAAGESDRVATLAGLARLAALQRADGSWPGVDLFQVLDVLLRAAKLGHRLETADASVLRAVDMLTLMLRDDGSWGRDTGPERTLIGWRGFRRALEIRED
jgi:hypothetical protein